MAKGKTPKVQIVASRRGRSLTFPRGDRPKGPRYKARKGINKVGKRMPIFVLNKQQQPQIPCSEKQANCCWRETVPWRYVATRSRPA
ncbi:hypothetical protein GCM10007159_42120 [Modicisalibacter luteus]|nr:hypothetical protein GCM10007159_42120 [Halomonas lutea]